MRELSSSQLRQTFLEFFRQKDHQIWPSSPLIPADNTTLFTTAGVQQFIPFISGKVKPPKPRAASVQKCLRTDDISEVGDETHHTFFEMLGNWSFGDYFKKEAIHYAWEFLTKECQIPPERLDVTIFKGEEGIPRDEESYRRWRVPGAIRVDLEDLDKVIEPGKTYVFYCRSGLTSVVAASRALERGAKAYVLPPEKAREVAKSADKRG